MIGTLRVRLSSRAHIPVFCLEGSRILDREWYPHQFVSMAKTLLEARNWRIANDGNRLENKKFNLVLLPYYGAAFVRELPLWPQWYVPIPVKGKIILDVGAGCGESAFFYFRNGARKVICVEPDAPAVECLRENSKRHKWNVDIVPELFNLSMLNECTFDLLKIDIEGSEVELLKLSELPTPTVLESHTPAITNAFTRQFNARVVETRSDGISILQINC
jgi:SAM-dependent methyltransferase